jgi:hypothetical protein
MLPEILQSTNLFHLLHRIDTDLAAQQQKAGCPFCGGALHYSNYQRKPRGGPTLPENYLIRLSLCCSREECRRRTLPKSTLFMDRRVYFRVVILIVTTLSQSKPQEYSKNRLSKMIDADRKTINRWLDYFHELFPTSRIWQAVCGFFPPFVTALKLPGALVEYYLRNSKSITQAMSSCLVLLTTELPPGKMVFM